MHLRSHFRIGFIVLISAIGLAACQSAQAIVFLPSVDIDEVFDPFTMDGEFTVHNNTSEDVFAFVVANDTATDSFSGVNFWNSAIISRSLWEEGFDFFMGLPEWTAPDTSSIDWDSTFGAEFNQAIAYWAADLLEVSGTPIASETTEGPFFFSSELPASPFIAFGATGNTVGQGSTNVVPEPTAAWLLLTALVCLVGSYRNR